MENKEELICIFAFCYDECKKDTNRCSKTLPGSPRVSSVMSASKIYGDHLHDTLQNELARNPNFIFAYHRNCISKYVSTNTLTYFENQNQNDRALAPPSAKRTRSDIPGFDFQTNCLYCGGKCIIERDKKNPYRWIPAFQIRATMTQDQSKKIKQSILDKCDTHKK